MLRFFMALFCSSMAATAASAAAMPAELLGEWSPLPASACGVFTIRPDGYYGTADSEGYSCSLRDIKERPSNNRDWTASFVCSGEGSKPVKLQSLLQLRDFEGSPLLIVVEGSQKNASVVVLRRCGRR